MCMVTSARSFYGEMTSVAKISKFLQIYKCHMSRSISTNVICKVKPIRSLFDTQAKLPFTIKHLKFYCPASRTSQYLPGLYSSESRLELQRISYCTSTTTSDKSTPLGPSELDLPSPEELNNVEEKLNRFISLFFVSSKELPLSTDIVYIDNYNGQNKTHQGLLNFAIQKMKLRMLVHMTCLSINVETINRSSNLKDGSITIDWKMSYLSNILFLKTLSVRKRVEVFGSCRADVKKDGKIHRLCLEKK